MSEFLARHSEILAYALAYLVVSLLNGLQKTPVNGGLSALLRSVLDRVSVLVTHDGEGTVKAPLAASKVKVQQ